MKGNRLAFLASVWHDIFAGVYFAETAYVFLLSAKTWTFKQTTHTYTKWSRKISISILSDYYKTVFSYLSRGNENLLKSPCAVSQLIMRVSKPIQYDPKGEP